MITERNSVTRKIKISNSEKITFHTVWTYETNRVTDFYNGKMMGDPEEL